MKRSGTLTERERTAVMIRIEHPEKSQAECGRMMGISQSLFFKTPDRCKKEDGGHISQNKRKESGDGAIKRMR